MGEDKRYWTVRISKRWVYFFPVLIVIAGVLAWPQFMKRLAKSKASEVKTNLAAIFTGQISYHGAYGVYAQSPGIFDKVSWEPYGNRNLYSYFCGDEIVPCHHDKCGAVIHLPGLNRFISVSPMASDTAFVCVAIANVDEDPTLDVWSINEKKELVNWVNDSKE